MPQLEKPAHHRNPLCHKEDPVRQKLTNKRKQETLVLTILRKEAEEILYAVGVMDWTQEKFEGISALFLFLFILFFILLGEAGSEKCICSRHEEGQRNTILFLPFSSYSLLGDNSILNYNKVFYNKSQCLCVCAQSCPILCSLIDPSPPGSSVHGISQLRVLEWVAISPSREPSRPRGWICGSYTGRQADSVPPASVSVGEFVQFAFPAKP